MSILCVFCCFFFHVTAPTYIYTLSLHDALPIFSEWGKRVEGVGADIIVQPPNSSIFFAFVSVGMQESLGEQMASLSGVDERSEEHTSELQSLTNLVCRLLLEKKKK